MSEAELARLREIAARSGLDFKPVSAQVARERVRSTAATLGSSVEREKCLCAAIELVMLREWEKRCRRRN